MYFVPNPLSAETFVSAAVRVVFPWSTWPIVPTFTCGLFRSNFSFDIETPPGHFPRPVHASRVHEGPRTRLGGRRTSHPDVGAEDRRSAETSGAHDRD